MHGNIRIVILCVFVFCVVIVESDSIYAIKPEIKRKAVNELDLSDNSNSDNGVGNQVDSTVYQTVNIYYCSLDPEIRGTHLMVYGAQSWKFPVQDVNLILRYPPEDRALEYFEFNFANETYTEDVEFAITGFKVILYIDGSTSQGFITDGGILQDTITLSFISSQLTYLSYEFWLFGARKDNPRLTDLNSQIYPLC